MGKLTQLPVRNRVRKAGASEVRRIHRRHARYFAFLSYSHRDKELADWLHREIEKFRVPRALVGRLTDNGVIPRRLTPVFRDEQELAAAADLGEEIHTALRASQYLIVLCSPHAATSHWTNAEIEEFKRARPDDNILAAIASGEPFASDLAGREDEECFPPALRFQYDRRGRPTPKRAEPLAADLRGEGEVRRIGFLKLIAGMLGVGLDELVQRETRRRHQRMAWLAAAAFAGMTVTSGLAFTAIQARDAARDQRREAESLVEFMVGDLRNKLEPIGKLDALDGVGSRVLAYYSKQDTAQLSDDALLQRSRALNLMAEVAFNRGNLEEAQGLYRQAMAGTAEAVRRAPDDANGIFEHAQNVFWVGEVGRFAGRPQQAEAAYREYKRLADRLTTLEPDNLKYRMEVLYADEDLGIALFNQHRFKEAAAAFQAGLGQMGTLVALNPANTTYRKEYSNLLGWIADAQRAQGNFDAAIEARRRQLAGLKQLLAMGSDSDVQAKIITAHQGLGILLTERGQAAPAVEELRSAVDEAENLIPIEPKNTTWKFQAASARVELAKSLLAFGQVGEASQQAAQGCGQAAVLPTAFSTSLRKNLATTCDLLQSRLALSNGATDQASRFSNAALAAARAQHSEDPIGDRYRLAMAYRLVGDVNQQRNDPQGAAASWSAGLNGLPPNVAERPWETNERAELLLRLGRAKEAAPLSARLDSIRFHRMPQRH